MKWLEKRDAGDQYLIVNMNWTDWECAVAKTCKPTLQIGDAVTAAVWFRVGKRSHEQGGTFWTRLGNAVVRMSGLHKQGVVHLALPRLVHWLIT